MDHSGAAPPSPKPFIRPTIAVDNTPEPSVTVPRSSKSTTSSQPPSRVSTTSSALRSSTRTPASFLFDTVSNPSTTRSAPPPGTTKNGVSFPLSPRSRAAITDPSWPKPPPSEIPKAPTAEKAYALEKRYRYGMKLSQQGQHREAAKHFYLAALGGHALAICRLADYLQNGQGVRHDEAQAYEWYTIAASFGVEEAIFAGVECLLSGRGVEPDLEMAVQVLEMMGEAGSHRASLRLGTFYLGEEQGGKQGALSEADKADNWTQAHHWLERAHADGCAHAATLIGQALYRGDGVQQDMEAAAQWLMKAATRGDANAQFLLALTRLARSFQPENPNPDVNLNFRLTAPQPGTDRAKAEEDARDAVFWLRAAVVQKHPYAQLQLGRMMMEGQGCVQDVRAAVSLIRAAAEQGLADAQIEYAKCAAYGRGMTRDGNVAIDWLEKAAEQVSEHQPDAQFLLAHFLLCPPGSIATTTTTNGGNHKSSINNNKTQISTPVQTPSLCPLPVPRPSTANQNSSQKARAFQLTEMAANGGHIGAQARSGLCYLYGVGVQRDDKKGFDWVMKAANASPPNAMAQYYVGQCFASGRGTKKNMIKAVEWMERARDMQYRPAKEWMKKHALSEDLPVPPGWNTMPLEEADKQETQEGDAGAGSKPALEPLTI